MNSPLVRILLVEDSPSDADVLQETLRRTGLGRFHFTWVQRLQEALTRLRTEPFDVLLLDLSLPDSTGAETFRRARSDAPQVPIVVLTGMNDEWTGLAALREGVQDYLIKGQINGPQIARAIRYAVERNRAEEQTRRQSAVVAGIARIFREALTCQTEEELGRACLAVAEEITQSRFGFLGEINRQTGKMDDIAISNPGWKLCRMRDPMGHGRKAPTGFAIHGIYGRVLLDGQGFFSNDPPSHPDSIGTPEGHPPLKAFLGVPLIHAGRTIGMVALGNREGGYGPEDLGAVEALAPAIMQAFLSKRSEQALRELNETLEQRIAERTTEAEKSAQQLRALAAQLTQAEQKERQRLATILHDHLQQLLVGTKFHLGILRGQRKDPDLQEPLEQIDSLLDQSLDASRNLTVDLSPPILKHGNMPQVLQWLAEWMRSKHGLEVRLQTDEQANPQSHEVRALLFQAVRELLFNIVKHAKVCEATVELCRLEDQYVRVIVRDAGIGFDPSKGKTGSGSGFGLLSIRERLNWLGGTFQIDSRPGEGTYATLDVPVGLSMAVDTDETKTAAHAAGGSPAVDGSRSMPAGRAIRILLADDHAVMRDGLSSLLQRQLDIEVVGKATNGQEAVDLTLQLQPDVIIMDISMPRLDGVEATRQIKARHPHVQVIGLSMFHDEAPAKKMKAAGAACYLAKTSGPEALIAAIRSCSRGTVD